ncbi:hypothetical protein RSAG8_02934, partial [Rhizoctonia solani AG-8 WAC10335]
MAGSAWRFLQPVYNTSPPMDFISTFRRILALASPDLGFAASSTATNQADIRLCQRETGGTHAQPAHKRLTSSRLT